MRTAAIPSWFVPAPPLESYPRLPYRGEDGRAVLRRERCACGADVEQLSGEDPMTAVQRHNAAADHLLWRRDREAVA